MLAPIGRLLLRWSGRQPEHARKDAAEARDFELFAGTFRDGDAIPAAHGARGGNISPPLFWSTPPPGTAELVLVMYRTDRKASAPEGTHWLAWGIDPSAGGLGEGEAAPIEGRNDFGGIGYHGPTGEPSLYFILLYAVDRRLELPAGATRPEVDEALFGRVLGSASWLGK